MWKPTKQLRQVLIGDTQPMSNLPIYKLQQLYWNDQNDNGAGTMNVTYYINTEWRDVDVVSEEAYKKVSPSISRSTETGGEKV